MKKLRILKWTVRSLILLAVAAFLLYYPWPCRINVSEKLLVWENTHAGGSTETEWRDVTVKGVFKNSILGEDSFEVKELSIEGVELDAPDGDWSVTGFQNNWHYLIYAYVESPGKASHQFVGTMYHSVGRPHFVITLSKDLDPSDGPDGTWVTDKIITYPAKTREEAVALTRKIVADCGWKDTIWE